MTKINIIIFSKDRAAQTLACVKSLQKHFKDVDQATVSVLYKTSSLDYKQGYEKIKNKIKNIIWIPETDFKKQVIKLVNDTENKLTMFLVDDIIFINSFSLLDKPISFLESNALLTTSLRLHSGITSCYATGEYTNLPTFSKECVWKWENNKGDWGYPLSVDGNIYKTDLMKTIIKQLDFTNPNSFEAALDNIKHSSIIPKYMSCYIDAARLINIPANRVQSQYKNRHANSYSAKQLNEMLINNKEIDFAKFKGLSAQTCHVPVQYYFKDEEK